MDVRYRFTRHPHKWRAVVATQPIAKGDIILKDISTAWVARRGDGLRDTECKGSAFEERQVLENGGECEYPTALLASKLILIAANDGNLQAKVAELCNHMPPTQHGLDEQCEIVKYLVHSNHPRLFEENAKLTPVSALSAYATDMRYREILGKLASNAFNVQDEACRARGVAIFLQASAVNHSCSPTSYQTFNFLTPEKVQLVLRASRDIRRGEEITIAYMETGRPYWWRRAELKSVYNFLCDCDMCKAEISYKQEHINSTMESIGHNGSKHLSQITREDVLLDSYRCSSKGCHGCCSWMDSNRGSNACREKMDALTDIVAGSGTDLCEDEKYKRWLNGYLFIRGNTEPNGVNQCLSISSPTLDAADSLLALFAGISIPFGDKLLTYRRAVSNQGPSPSGKEAKILNASSNAASRCPSNGRKNAAAAAAAAADDDDDDDDDDGENQSRNKGYLQCSDCARPYPLHEIDAMVSMLWDRYDSISINAPFRERRKEYMQFIELWGRHVNEHHVSMLEIKRLVFSEYVVYFEQLSKCMIRSSMVVSEGYGAARENMTASTICEESGMIAKYYIECERLIQDIDTLLATLYAPEHVALLAFHTLVINVRFAMLTLHQRGLISSDFDTRACTSALAMTLDKSIKAASFLYGTGSDTASRLQGLLTDVRYLLHSFH